MWEGVVNKPIEVGCKVMIIGGSISTILGKIGVVLYETFPYIDEEGCLVADDPCDINCVFPLDILDTCWVIKSLGEPFHWEGWSQDLVVVEEKFLVRLPDEEGVEEFDKQEELETV